MAHVLMIVLLQKQTERENVKDMVVLLVKQRVNVQKQPVSCA